MEKLNAQRVIQGNEACSARSFGLFVLQANTPGGVNAGAPQVKKPVTRSRGTCKRAGIVELRGMDVGSAFGMFGGDLVDRSVRASLLFSSALCFQRVTTASPNPKPYLVTQPGGPQRPRIAALLLRAVLPARHHGEPQP